MKNKQFPLMSIVVLNWNGLEHTKVCLEHLRKVDYPNYEIIIVDNGSRADQKAWLKKQSDVLYVDNPVNKGFTGGHIDGLAKASGEFIVLLNNDAVMQKDYLRLALEDFADDSVAVVGGRSYFWNDTEALLDQKNQFYSYQVLNNATGEAFMQETDFGVPQVVNNVSGSAVVMRRSVINEIGYLYDRFFAYFEETDLFARVKRAGYKVLYDPRLHIWHRNGASSGSSSGSSFFYYQIFRNRFIFAIRNYETRRLWPFFYNYAKIAFGSFVRLLLRPKSANRVMYKSYVRAAWYNLIRLPVLYGSRRRLHRQLGKSNYNHSVFIEQTGISFVFDCTTLSPKACSELKQRLSADRNPLHEYILVVKQNESPDFDPAQPNVRFVTNRGYFENSSLNLGCLAARFDWMAVCSPDNPADPKTVDDTVTATMNTGALAIGFGDASAADKHILLIHKNLFTRMGGLPKNTNHIQLVDYVLRYAAQTKLLLWQSAPKNATLSKLSSSKQAGLDTHIKRDDMLRQAARINWYGKLKNKYSRLGQFSMLGRWLFSPKISLYLKGARIKNVLKFTLTLNRPSLALELRHMRNEVILNTARGIDINLQNKTTKKQLAELLKKPNEIPVFIICRDRVDCLRDLVAWLEAHGQRKIVFIDNDSVYPPLVAYFQKTPYQVLKLYRNVGHTSPWTLGIIRTLLPDDFYIVTDPDVIPVKECPKDVIKHFLRIHKDFFIYQKVGFGLRIDDLPDHYPLKQSVIEWESQFWKKEVAPKVYEAGIDTTFALYKPYTYTYTLHPSLRTGLPYVARHMPWYADPKKISEEEIHYRYRANHNISSWNADELKDRYVKEMTKKKR